jgi:hypothetical protein
MLTGCAVKEISKEEGTHHLPPSSAMLLKNVRGWSRQD